MIRKSFLLGTQREKEQALCDPKFIDMLQEHIADIHHIELAEQAKFTQVYMDSMEIAPWH